MPLPYLAKLYDIHGYCITTTSNSTLYYTLWFASTDSMNAGTPLRVSGPGIGLFDERTRILSR